MKPWVSRCRVWYGVVLKKSMSFINASLWDVMSTGLAVYDADTVKKYETSLLSGFYRLLEDGDFNDAITLGTNQANRVRRRFEMATQMFREVLGD